MAEKRELGLNEINIKEGVARFGGNRKRYFIILRKFAKEAESMPTVEEAANPDTLKHIQSWVHSIKGVTGNLSLTGLYNQASEMDKLIKDGNFNVESYEALVEYYRSIKLSLLESIPE